MNPLSRLSNAMVAAAMALSSSLVGHAADEHQAPPELAEKLASFTVQELTPQPVDGRIELELQLEGVARTMELRPYSLRSPEFRLLVQMDASGELTDIEAPAPATYRGALTGVAASSISASVREGRVRAMIDDGAGHIWHVEPLAEHDATAPLSAHLVYRADDVIGRHQDFCGIDVWAEPLEAEAPASGGGIAGIVNEIVEVALDSDFEYYNDANNADLPDTLFDMESVMNDVAFVYERDVDITYEITVVIIRTDPADPYDSGDQGVLLCQMKNRWNSSANPEFWIQRDAAQLFTDQTGGDSSLGVAWAGTMCNLTGNPVGCSPSGNLAYSVVQSKFQGATADERISLSAHELGHTWNAGHCDGTSNCHIMCSGLGGCDGVNGSNLFFGPVSTSAIVSFRNAVPCPTPISETPLTLPFQDDFPNSSLDTVKWSYRDGAVTSTAGVNEPSASRSLNLDSVNGTLYGDDEIRSNVIDLSSAGTVQLSYYTEHRGVEAGETLTVSYRNDSFVWVVLNIIQSDGVDQNEFDFHSQLLPSAALHEGFRLRFRTDGSDSGDDWYIDDVLIDVDNDAPANNNCVAAIDVVSFETVFFDNVDATTDGPSESCDGGDGIGSDVWFTYLAECTGNVIVRLCDSDFDTKVAIYQGGCPAGADTAIACNDDSCGARSQVSFTAIDGVPYTIRVGGNDNAQGAGGLIIFVTCAPPCPADVDGSGEVDVSDLVTVILEWGTDDPIADVNDDGVVDVGDLVEIILGWGPCV